MAEWLFRILKGALTGVGAILPGISGGVLMVVLGIYKPVMAFLAHPIKTFAKQWPFLLPVLIGWAIGFLGLARVVEWLFTVSQAPATWLFIGLIVGTLPSLFHEAGEQGRPTGAWVSLCASALLMGGLLWLLSSQGANAVTPNVWWWLVCGALWGLGFIVPGLSPSSFFLFFGLYQPMTAALSHLDMAVVLPMLIGLAATVVLLVRGMNLLLKRAYPIVMHAILGIVLASTLAILPLDAPAALGDIALYALCFVLGLALALGMDVLGKRLQPAAQ
ncbi:DUF368 domain-containing protein [Clostridia bacterium]|nr:DUF368 domain-containing protein [Clostridia bacterium]